MIVQIEGNITSGKTKLFEGLKKHYETKLNHINRIGCTRLRQRNGEFKSFHRLPKTGFVNIINNDHTELTGFAAPCFSYEWDVITERKKIFKQATSLGQDIIIADCGISSAMIFSEALTSNNDMTRPKCDELWTHAEDSPSSYLPCMIIFIESDPIECLQRIHARSIDSEKFIDLTFLQHLEREYYKFLYSWMMKKAFVINISSSVLYNEDLYDSIICRINDFFHSHQIHMHGINYGISK